MDILSGIYSSAHAVPIAERVDKQKKFLWITTAISGVKFFPEGNPMRGQNERAFPAVYQVIDGKFAIVYPKAFANSAPILSLPPSFPFAAR